MKVKRTVDTDEYLRMVARVITATGKRVADADPDDLRALLALRDQVDAAILTAVRGLRASGSSWEDIGAATGTTRQAAIMKWTHKI